MQTVLKLEDFYDGRRHFYWYKLGVHFMRNEEGGKKAQLCYLFPYEQSSSNVGQELDFSPLGPILNPS